MLTLLGAALVVAALSAVYLTAAAARRSNASPFVARLARGNILALSATIILAVGTGALMQAAMLGNSVFSLIASAAALVVPFIGFFAVLKARPLPEPQVDAVPANSPLPPVRHGRTGERLAADAAASLGGLRQVG